MRKLLVVSIGALAVRIASAAAVSFPGYTDAYYYSAVAGRLARGQGLTADFLWNFIEAQGQGTGLPVDSHRFWMPLATGLQAVGILVLGPAFGDFGAAQLAVIAVAAFLPAVTYAAARSLGASTTYAIAAAAVAGLGGAFAPGWVATDAFAPAAVLGTLFFLAFARAAGGSVKWAMVSGALVGLLYLARSEGAFFGIPLLALTARPATRRAGAAGSLVALAIGLAWFARLASLGTGDLLARAVLLVRYEDFFHSGTPAAAGMTSVGPPYGFAAFFGALPTVMAAKGVALATNAITALFAFAAVLGPLAALGAWWWRARPEVRAWSLLAVLVYLLESLLFTLHSTRGSYFHSLAAFFPFGVALAAAAGQRLLAARGASVATAWIGGTLLLSAAVSYAAVQEWRSAFGTLQRERAEAARAITSGPIMAIDAAAWRVISGKPAVVMPSEGGLAAECVALRYEAKWLVLERAHFSAYDAWYRGETRPAWLGPPERVGDIVLFPAYPRCEPPLIR